MKKMLLKMLNSLTSSAIFCHAIYTHFIIIAILHFIDFTLYISLQIKHNIYRGFYVGFFLE